MSHPTIVRLLALAAAVWTVVYLGIYVAEVRSQDEDPAAFYVVLLVAAAALLVAVGVRPHDRRLLMVGTGLLVVSMLLGMVSIGFWLLPAVIVAGIAAAVTTARDRATVVEGSGPPAG